MDLLNAEPMHPANEGITVICEERMVLCAACLSQLEQTDYREGKVVKS